MTGQKEVLFETHRSHHWFDAQRRGWLFFHHWLLLNPIGFLGRRISESRVVFGFRTPILTQRIACCNWRGANICWYSTQRGVIASSLYIAAASKSRALISDGLCSRHTVCMNDFSGTKTREGVIMIWALSFGTALPCSVLGIVHVLLCYYFN